MKSDFMGKYIFLTDEGTTFQPNSNGDFSDIENLQVIGFASGENSKEAFGNLLKENKYLKKTSFTNIFSYKMDNNYEETKCDFTL